MVETDERHSKGGYPCFGLTNIRWVRGAAVAGSRFIFTGLGEKKRLLSRAGNHIAPAVLSFSVFQRPLFQSTWQHIPLRQDTLAHSMSQWPV